MIRQLIAQTPLALSTKIPDSTVQLDNGAFSTVKIVAEGRVARNKAEDEVKHLDVTSQRLPVGKRARFKLHGT